MLLWNPRRIAREKGGVGEEGTVRDVEVAVVVEVQEEEPEDEGQKEEPEDEGQEEGPEEEEVR